MAPGVGTRLFGDFKGEAKKDHDFGGGSGPCLVDFKGKLSFLELVPTRYRGGSKGPVNTG